MLWRWGISHRGARKGAGRQGLMQVATAAIKAGAPKSQCNTYEDVERLLKAAAESVGCTKSALPRVSGSIGTVPKHVEGGVIPNPDYDEKEFKALPEEQRTHQRERSMKSLQGPSGRCLRTELVVAHEIYRGTPS